MNEKLKMKKKIQQMFEPLYLDIDLRSPENSNRFFSIPTSFINPVIEIHDDIMLNHYDLFKYQ